MNYTQLVEAVKGYAENDFPDSVAADNLTSKDQLDTFIRQAEQRVYNTVQLLDLRKNVTGNCTTNNKYLSVPSDWLANFSLAVIDPSTGEYEFLLNKDVNYIREAFPFPSVTGKPTHYAMFDKNSYILGPTPDDDYEVELHYFYYPQSIVDAGTSWLGDNFDSVLLYGTLLEAYTYMKGEGDVIGMYQTRYTEALAMLKQFAEGKNRQDMYRTPQARYPVQ
jgi:hypothetical protein